jgi:CRISPR-associated protein Csm4
MNYSILKLRFRSPLHAGDSSSARALDSSHMTIHADTIFSALCHEAIKSGGEKEIEQLYQYAINDKLKLSDAMPYSGDTLYLPKPIITSSFEQKSEPVKRKKLKKLRYLPVILLPSYLSYLRGDTDFDYESAECSFGESYIQEKAVLRGDKNAVPYSIGLFSFDDDCGLYLIIGYEEEEIAEKVISLIRRIGLSGIGGKVSSGYGKFELIERQYLEKQSVGQQAASFPTTEDMLENNSYKSYLLLTSSLPKNEELEEAMEGSSYGIIRRGGFVQSETYSDRPLKKQTQYFFEPGSVFRQRFQGDVYDVSRNAGHPVYRYAKPLFLGVDL